MAVARLPLPGSGRDGVVTLPHPLDAADAARIRRIFALQRSGDIPGAIAETAHLDDDTLLGDLLADRYLGPNASPEPGQLRLWLKTFSDLPDAPAIYRLLAGVSRHGSRIGPIPSSTTLGIPLGTSQNTAAPAPLPGEADPAEHVFTRNALLDHVVQSRLADDTLAETSTGAAPGSVPGNTRGAASALRLIAETRHIDPLYASQLRAEVALRLFTDGQTDLAFRTARATFDATGDQIGLAGYVAGLAAWRGGHPDQALPLFEAASRASLTPAGIRAGAAFWAARAHLRVGDTAGYQAWLQRAGAAPGTFYGLLAERLLGRVDAAWDHPVRQPVHLAGFDALPTDTADNDAGRAILSEVDVDAVAASPVGRRVFALLQVDEPARADAALRRFWPEIQADMALCRSVQLVAETAGLAPLSTQLADILRSRDAQPGDHAGVLLPKLSPQHGFTVNPALVYALTRLESNFDASAVSEAGAHGLMQLLPVTAGLVLGQPARFADDASPLHQAGLNLELGQRYLIYLAARASVGGDLVRLLASYNAGPTAVSRWNVSIDSDDDPLMFIESLPSDETRDYVRRAFTYLWVYSRRFGLPSPSLASLAEGQWPTFADEQAVRIHRAH